ncbi:uncharacterized protein LOC131072519 [Cryptomeria japonica]|uniref:uncharacterized protein LOC131072519 n=1 Tax=Cryptomeria japonica TaxID=3369 RepID=UPI0027DA3DEB|nr:uncharacterized protein LOC131072519 [Cryptomeria japonica]
MDTHEEDLLGIDTARDFRRLVMDSLDKLNLLMNGKSFKFHVEQCKSLCAYMLSKFSPYIDNNGPYVGYDIWSKRVHLMRAWKEIYRAMKEAEVYLKHCSTDSGWLKCFIMANTGEAFALHMHDLAWSLLCLDLVLLCPIEAWDEKIHFKEFCNRISNFFSEMSNLHLDHFGFKFQDHWHLLMACNQTVAKAWTLKQKNKIGVLQFMERKISEAITNECKIESATGTPTCLQIPPKDLIKKKSIGHGSFGQVYEGSWLGHKVAVKDIPIDAPDLFEREITVLSKLHSPFIVQLIGACIEGRSCYIVMELVSSSLDKLLSSSGGRAPLALPVAVDMMLQISRGMEYLHSRGIMHLDLKSSNVLIQPSAVPEFREQGYGRVKLCDFGMASLRLSSVRCEDPKGTCYWRAPEAFPFPNEELLPEIDTLNEYTYKADVYSFAMTCYEILTGKQPFLDVHPKDLYRLIVQGKRPVLQPPSCPAVLANYIAKCWDTDPSRRPSFGQVSTFMRNMKLFILRSTDPCDWLANSGDYFHPPELSLELVTSKEEAFDESSADEKLELITRVLDSVPAEIKRRYNINVTGTMPSEKNSMPFEKNPLPSKKLNARQARSSLLFHCGSLYHFDLNDILLSSAEVLGNGSFGTTYKVYLHDFVLVVKRLRDINGGDFERRLQALGSLKHPNLVSLEAYYISKWEKLLIYNYLPNGSLCYLLHTGKVHLTWCRRMQIAADVAVGLAFLHKSDIAHGNVKSSNVLLDNDGNACLAESCFADLIAENSSVAKKSAAYIAPEEHNGGRISKESDVYSFGVVLLECVTGKNPSLFNTDLPTWIFSIKEERWTTEVLDVRLNSEEGATRNILRMLKIAMLCCSPHVYVRPRMRNVIKMIREITTAVSCSEKNTMPSEKSNALPSDRNALPSEKSNALPSDKNVLPSEKSNALPSDKSVLPSEKSNALPSDKNVLPSEKSNALPSEKSNALPSDKSVLPSEKSNALPSDKNVPPSEKSNALPSEKSNALSSDKSVLPSEKSNTLPSDKNVLPSEKSNATNEEGLLIYNDYPNGSVYSLLHTEEEPLKWDRRTGIAADVIWATPSEKNSMPSENFNERKDPSSHAFNGGSLDLDDLMSTEKLLGKGIFASTYRANSPDFSVLVKRLSQGITFVRNKRDFYLDDLCKSSGELLGNGIFASTYRANLPDFSVAVKRLSNDIIYVRNKRDFEQRLQALGSLEHTNLVSLQAYHISEEDKLLIYNYLPNGSLYSLLHTEKEPLTWYRRMKIAEDVALGLAFLHKSGIAHSNVKSSNILLDNDGNACLADSCLADIVEYSSVGKNSMGYMAPEEYSSGRISKESDMYRFGVVLLELVTGRNPSRFSTDLPTWIFSIEEERWTTEVLDVGLKGEGVAIENMLGMLGIAMTCCSPLVYARPKINNVVELIREITTAYSCSEMNTMPSEKSNALPSDKNVPPSEKSNAQKDHSSLVFHCGSIVHFDPQDLMGSCAELLGKGSFGTTYRTDSHNISLVVKILSKDTIYVGDRSDFERGVQALGSLKHTNLVSLQAYNTLEEERLLIYNYYPNGSLYTLLHTEEEPLKWDRRMEIAADVALGLEFLHKSGIAHGNVKTSNILLDNEGNACLTDTCLAGILKNSSVTEKFSGYMAPEQYHSKRLSEKSDVYSFGVVLLELVSGKNPSSVNTHLPTWIVCIEKERWSDEVLDERVERDGRGIQNMLGMLEIAIRCTSPHVYSRPMMNNVVEMIQGMRAPASC